MLARASGLGHRIAMNSPIQINLELDRLRRAVAQPSGAGSSDFDLAPGLRAALPPNYRLRPAAVLIAVQPSAKGAMVWLTQRPNTMRHHPGQVAFPGGKVDKTDASPLAAALREAHEEIGLPPAMVQVLGALPNHETVTGFDVTPFVGQVAASFQPVAELGEVEEVFAVPLGFLMNPANHAQQARIWHGKMRPYLTMPYGPHYIWGATARMIVSLSNAWGRVV